MITRVGQFELSIGFLDFSLLLRYYGNAVRKKGFIMDIEIGKLTSKGQTTIPISIRKALALSAGDEILFQMEHNRVVMRKARPLDIEYLKAVQLSCAAEWNSAEDNEAYNDL